MTSFVYNPNQKLTPHFKHYEVCKSYTADRHGIDNTPSPEVLSNAYGVACNILEPIRTTFGIPFTPNSWYRSEALEFEICSTSFIGWCRRYGYDPDLDSSWDEYFSRKSHPNGEAVDIELVGISNDFLFEWIDDNLIYDQLIREFPKAGDPKSGWVHVSWSYNHNRKQKFTIG